MEQDYLDDTGISDEAMPPTGDSPAEDSDTPPATDDQLRVEGGTPPDPDDPNYKYWQGAYTKSRQRDRQVLGKVQDEHKQFGEVLRNFYTSDEYALQVIRQRFPQLASRLSLDETSVPRSVPETTPPSGSLVRELERHLGDDLAFLAPRLGPVLERAIQGAIQGAVEPLHQQTRAQHEAARKAEEDRLMAELDQAHPEWEARYGSDMQALDKFLASDQLSHPKFGNKYQLLLRMLNSDLPRVEAARGMVQAGRNRLSTGRTGRAAPSNTDQQITQARTDSEAFRIAAQAALAEMRRG